MFSKGSPLYSVKSNCSFCLHVKYIIKPQSWIVTNVEEEVGYILYGSCTYLFVSIYLLNFAGLQVVLYKPEKNTLCLPFVFEVLGAWVKSVCGWVSQFDNKWLSTLLSFLYSQQNENWMHWGINSLAVWDKMPFSNGKGGSFISQLHEKYLEGSKWQFPYVISGKIWHGY